MHPADTTAIDELIIAYHRNYLTYYAFFDDVDGVIGDHEEAYANRSHPMPFHRFDPLIFYHNKKTFNAGVRAANPPVGIWDNPFFGH